MNTYNLTFDQLNEMYRRLDAKLWNKRKEERNFVMRAVKDRVNVERNYKSFYGEKYERAGIRKKY